MTAETEKVFNDRRASDERSMANNATDEVQSIAHTKLAKLHTQKAGDGDIGDCPQTTALDVTAVDGFVAVSDANGDVMRLTPNAAALTSDLLLAVSRHAGSELSEPDPTPPAAPRVEPTAAERAI